MADELGGLFDSDPSFLEELASGSRSNPQPGMIGQQGVMQQSAMIGQPQIPVQNMGIVNQMPQQQGYGQFPQQQMGTGQFNQYNNPQMGQQMQLMPGQVAVSQQGHAGQMMSPQRNPQYAQAQQGMSRQHQQGQMQMNMAGPQGPRLPNPQHQMMMGQGQGQMQGWNVQMFNPQQQQQQQQGQGQYLSHHDYAVPSSNSMNTSYQNQMIGNQATFVQQVASPSGGVQGQSQPNRMPVRQTMYTNQRMPFGQNFPNSQQQVMTSMNSNQMMMQQQQQFMQGSQQQPNNMMHMQQYRTNSNSQMHQGMLNSPQQNAVRFSQTSPNQGSVQHRLPFTSMPQQRQTVPMLSPRPTPPPPSPSGSQAVLSPTGSTSVSQNNIVPNVGMSGNSGNLFNQGANSEISVNGMTSQKQFNVQDQGQTNQMISPPQGGTANLSQIASPNSNSGQAIINVSATVNSSSNSFSNGPNQVSPTPKVLSPNMNSVPQNVKREIQTVTQQIQQLYNQPQTQDTQQKLLDLQERLRNIKSQHMIAAQTAPGQGQKPSAGSQQPQMMTNLPGMTQQTAETPQKVAPQQNMSEMPQNAQQIETSPQQQQQNNEQTQQQNVAQQPEQKIDIQSPQSETTGIQLQQQQTGVQQQPGQQQLNTSQPQQQIPNTLQQQVPIAIQQPGNMPGGPMQQGMMRPLGGIQPGVPGQQGLAFKINTQPGQRIQLVRGPAQPGTGPQKIFIIQPQQASPQQQQQQLPQSSLPLPASGSIPQSVSIPQSGNLNKPLLKTIPQPQHVIISASLSSGGNAQLGQAQVVQGQTQILPNVQGVLPQRMPVPVQVQIPQQMIPNSASMPQNVPQPQFMPNSQMMGSPQVIGNVSGMQHSPVPVQLPQGMQHSPAPMSVQILNEPENIGPVSQQQEKANKIIAEAIAKAQRSGATIPKVMSPADLPSTLADIDLPDSTGTPTDTPTKGKRKRKPREPKKDKSPKKKREKVKVESTDELSNVDIENMTEDGDDDMKEKRAKKKPGERKQKGERTPKVAGKKKKKPPATFLKNKKRKRRGSSDGSDLEIKFTPPPSPLNDELKRRSGRHTKRKKYNDELDLDLSDEDTMDAAPETEGAVVKPVQLFVDNPAEEDAVVVEKILGSRMRTKDPDVSNDEDEEDDVEEFYVKYKNFSYLHCEWKTEKELMKDKRIPGKIRRYKIKKAQNNFFSALDDEELFNPEYVEVDRVLEESVTIDPNSQEEVTHYLVKWRGLPYEDSTWELQQDVDPEKVRLFKQFRELPDEEDRQFVPRPTSGSDWKALQKTHTYKNGNTLREYQLEGVNWLTFSWYKRQNCILADEMGLGKTIQSITFLHEIFSYGIKGPFLVVAPLSTIANWMREFELWTDMNVIVYHGTSPSRFMLQEYEMYYKDENGQKITDFYKFHVIITTYELIISDLEVLRDIEWRCVIIDEAHRLKNKNCRLMEGLRFFDFEHKVLLSGTPLQNNVEELFSLLNFLEPSQFHSSTEFLAEFGTLKTEEQVEKLKAILKPMMLRRLKEDVEKNLAAKEETIIEVELTNIQKKYYRAILEKNFSFLHKGTQSSANVPNLMNTMMELRKCCNHPYLINGAEENILSEMKMKQHSSESDPIVHALIQASGKFVLLDKLLPKLKQNGHKVLIFSQMIRVLDILEDYLVHKRYLYERIDGRITGNLRQEAIDRFSKPDSDRFVFLLCTRAGGLGINLTAADTVIIYDSDWNPQNDLQAQARCHRIGQSKMVKVYRLITRNSYEREMFDRASMKLGLDKAVLQSMGGEKISPQAQLSKREIEELLRKGAYGALMEDDSAGDAFCEEDIDQILQRRTQVIQIESEGKGSTFAKASFSMTSNRNDIDINDPEFWQKWAKKADVDVDAGDKELIIEEPRVRKKTSRYGNDNSVVDMSDLDSSSGSETDSQSTSKGRRGRGRRRQDEDTDFESERHVAKSYGSGYGRSELFKVEKGLLVYGWGRWSDILSHANWKRHMDEKDVEKVSRAILIYSLGYYKGDERIKEFIWDLVSPSGDAVLKNHSGLSAPVPRGRKGRRNKEEKGSKEDTKSFSAEEARAGCKVDPNVVLGDNGYKKHLHRHSNKVLLRVRTLYYLQHEVLGKVTEAIANGANVADINIPLPAVDVDPPAYWWDTEADKSLLVGVYKHGYEKYNRMRQDPTLTFLSRCGPPDGAALAAEMKDDDDDEDKVDNDEEDESVLSVSDVTSKKPSEAPTPVGTDGEEGEKLPFPTVSDLNTRLRRIITNYQRDYKKQQQKKEQQAKKIEKREKMDAIFRERENRRRETQQRWVRREETDFYRVVSTYGIEFDRHKGRYIWDKFRQMAKLEKKTDEQLTEYFISFYHMCLRVCRKIKEDAYPPTPLYVEAITEERASRCIARIDLLSKIREEIIVHPKMRERIMLCKTSYDLPTWWINGVHDRELLVGAAKHGLAKTETFILGDPAFSFSKYCKPPEPTSQPNSPANFKLFGKDIGKVKDEPGSSLKEDEKSETKPSDKEIKSETKEENPSTPSNPLDEDDEDTSEYHQEMFDAMVTNKKEDKKTEDKQEEEAITTKHDKDEKIKTKNEKEEEQETKITVSDFIQQEVEKLTENEKETKVKKEPVNSDNDESKLDLKKEKHSEEQQKNEGSSEKDSNLKKDGEECDKVSVKTEVKGDKEDDEDEEVRRTFEEGDKTDFLNKVKEGLSTHWPKDRIVFHRLEHICYCIETGEWPFGKKMPNPHILGIDSGSATPTLSRTPTLTPKGDEDPGQALQEMMKAKSKMEKDFEVQLSEGDGLKLTFHKRAKEKERRPDLLETEKAARIQQILAQSAAASTASSDESRPNSTLSSSQVSSGLLPWQQPNSPYFFLSQTPDSLFMNGSPSAEAEMLMNQSLLEQGLLFPGRRRGRKRKEEKLAEIAMAEALARRQMARAVASLDPESRVPVINLEDGSRIAGDKAPLKKDLDTWLDQHPGYVIDRVDDELEEGEIVSDYSERRRGRKPKVDPAFLEVDKLTGEENVSVINRLTGKKITGAKAPPLRYLAEWLEQNPMWDVDPKWAELVRAKGSLPKQLLPRVVTPNRRSRGRPARDSPPLAHSMLGTSDPHAAAAMAATLEAMNAAQLMAAGIPKLPLPFGSLPGLGLGNPLLGLAGLGIPGLPSTPPLSSKDSDSKRKDREDKDGSKSPHPSFPMLYNPLLYNPLLAAQGLGFPLPTSLSSPGLSSRLLNGHTQSDSEDEPKISKSRRASEQFGQDEAEDLSYRSEKKVIENIQEAHSSGKHKPEPMLDDSEQPCDLSMKSRSKEEPGTKIIGSDKLSKIVDSLKDRVNKMDGKPMTSISEKAKESKKSKLDSLLFSLASQSSGTELSSSSSDRRPSLTSPTADRRPSLTSPSTASTDRRPSFTSSSSDRRLSLTSPTSERLPSVSSPLIDRRPSSYSSSERRPSLSDKQVVVSSDKSFVSKLLTSHSETSLMRKSSLSSPISLTSSTGIKPSTSTSSGVKPITKEPVPQIVQELLAAKQLKDAAKLQKEMDLAAKQQRAIEALVAKQRQMEEAFFLKRTMSETKLLKDSKEKTSSERSEKGSPSEKFKESKMNEDKL